MRSAVLGWLRGLAALLLLAGALLGLALGLDYARSAIHIEIDGQRTSVHTRVATGAEVLREAEISLLPEDLVAIGGSGWLPHDNLNVPLAARETIRIRRARPVALSVDGQLWQIRTHATTVGQALADAGVLVGPGDEIWLREPTDEGTAACDAGGPSARRCGQRVNAETELAAAAGVYLASRIVEPVAQPTAAGQPNSPPLIALHRASAVSLQYGGKTITLHTTAETVAQLLREQGITLFLADEVHPDLQARIRPGLAIAVRRSLPVQIVADGKTIRTRTLAATVAGVLSQEGIALVGRDRVAPGLDSPIRSDMSVRVTRVREDLAVDFQSVPYQTIWVADPEMEIDTRRLVQRGELGLTKHRFRIVYEDDVETSRTLEDAWIEQEAITRTYNYGTKIVIRTLDTPDGPIEYWRKMRVYTVSYTAASSGKDKTHPRYGYTRLGVKATKGIVAVDPTVIPLRTRMYIPGYGRAIAADTGGGVKGKLVDLCFDVGAYQSWHWWTDIYLLTPVPPRSQIRWLLPDWPTFPDRRR